MRKRMMRLKNGSILLLDHPLSKTGLIDGRTRTGIKIISETGFTLLYAVEDLESKPVVGYIEVGKPKSTPTSGKRFCNCRLNLIHNNAEWTISVITRESRDASEITSIVEIRRLAFVDKLTQMYLAKFVEESR